MALELRGVRLPRSRARDRPTAKASWRRARSGRPVTALAELREAVASYTARAAEKMRRQNLATAHLMVFIETNRFKPEDAAAIRRTAGAIARRDKRQRQADRRGARRPRERSGATGYRYKKAGVVLLDLHPAAAVQDGLFDEADSPRRNALMRTVDGSTPGTAAIPSASLRPAAAKCMEAAQGAPVALLHDGVGRAAAGLAPARARAGGSGGGESGKSAAAAKFMVSGQGD